MSAQAEVRYGRCPWCGKAIRVKLDTDEYDADELGIDPEDDDDA